MGQQIVEKGINDKFVAKETGGKLDLVSKQISYLPSNIKLPWCTWTSVSVVNQLKALPPEFGTLKFLKVLKPHNNKIEELLQEIIKLPVLEELIELEC